MLNKAKEAIVSADSRTKGILAMAVVYVVIMLATVSSGAVNQITNFIPTVDITLKDGLQEEKDYLVKQDTVSNVLNELNVELDTKDTLNKDKEEIVQQDDYIKITTVEKIEKIPYSTKTKGSGSWTKTVVQEGKDGKAKRTYLLTYANGKETNKKMIKEEIIEEPVDKVIQYGGVLEGTTFTGRLTLYGGDCTGCGGTSSSGGQKYYCLAADRSIPFGTVIKISNHNLSTAGTIYGIVVDRGGAIKGNKIDIFNGSESSGKKYFSGGTSYNTKFEVVSLGSGNANFWR